MKQPRKSLTKEEANLVAEVTEYYRAMVRCKGKPPEKILVTQKQWHAYRRVYFTGLHPDEVAELTYEGVPLVVI